MAADFTISQAGGAGAGTLNTELLAVWGGLVLQLDAAAAAAYSWTILDKPHGAVATIVSPTAQNATLTPDELPGRWRIQLTTPDGTRVLVFEVTKTVAGVVYNFGLGVTPAHLERPSEAGGRGAARVFERFRASLLALISALPLAEKLLLRDAAGAAAATSFTGASTHDASLVAASGRKVLIHGFEGPRLRVDGAELNIDRWDAGIPGYAHCATISPIGGGGLYMSNASGTTEIIAGASDVAVAATGAVSVTAGSTVARSVNGLTCTESNSSGTYLVATDGPLRIQPAQAVSGAGRDYTFGGGPGQTPGTHFAGKTRADLGTPVGNDSTPFEFLVGGAVRALVRGILGTWTEIAHQVANGGLFLRALETNGAVWVQAAAQIVLKLQGSSATHFLDFSSTRIKRQDSGQTREHWRSFVGESSFSSAGTTALETYAIPTNEGVCVEALCTVTNTTNKRTSYFRYRFVAQNNAGTGSDNGAATSVGTNSIASGEAGVDATLTRSTTSVVLSAVRPDADARKFRWEFFVRPGALT